MIGELYQKARSIVNFCILYLSNKKQEEIEKECELLQEIEDSKNARVEIRKLRRQVNVLEDKLKNSTPITDIEKLLASKQIPAFYIPFEGVVMWENEACRNLFTNSIRGKSIGDLKVIENDSNWDKKPIYNPLGELIGYTYEAEKYFVRNTRNILKDGYAILLNWKRKLLPTKDSSAKQKDS